MVGGAGGTAKKHCGDGGRWFGAAHTPAGKRLAPPSQTDCKQVRRRKRKQSEHPPPRRSSSWAPAARRARSSQSPPRSAARRRRRPPAVPQARPINGQRDRSRGVEARGGERKLEVRSTGWALRRPTRVGITGAPVTPDYARAHQITHVHTRLRTCTPDYVRAHQIMYVHSRLRTCTARPSNIPSQGLLTLAPSGDVAASTMAWLWMPRMLAGFKLHTSTTRRCCISAHGEAGGERPEGGRGGGGIFTAALLPGSGAIPDTPCLLLPACCTHSQGTKLCSCPATDAGAQL